MAGCGGGRPNARFRALGVREDHGVVDACRFDPRALGALDLRDDSGALQHATARIDGDRMWVTLHDGRVRGSATLVRR